MNYNKLNEHIKNKFSSKDKVQQLKSLPKDEQLDSIEDNKVYQVSFSCLAVDLIDSKNKIIKFGLEMWNKILSEFVYGVSKIMKEYNGLWISVQGDAVYCIFDTQTKEDIAFALRCTFELNTFRSHLNKLIRKYFPNNTSFSITPWFDYNNQNQVDFGIGLWYSQDNYISKVGVKDDRDIVFMGDAVNWANTLAKKANRGVGMFATQYSPILINDLIKNNLNNEEIIQIQNVGSFRSHNIESKNIYGCDLYIESYSNFIKNSV